MRMYINSDNCKHMYTHGTKKGNDFMSQKTIPISVRLSEEDADFLASLKLDGASTPSDKLRAIISQARMVEKGGREYGESLNLLRNLVVPTRHRLLENERKHNLHSELIAKFTDWSSEAMAYFITSLPNDKKPLPKEALIEIEEGVVKRVIALIENILRLGITDHAPCYNPKVISSKFDTILELTKLVNLYRQSIKEK